MEEYVNERYRITQAEFDKWTRTLFASLEPPVLKVYSVKEKKKIISLMVIARQFERGREYAEREVNDIIKPIWADFATIRRALTDYGFMARRPDGTGYRVL